VRRKDHSCGESPGCPDIAFYDPHTAGPARYPLNPNGRQRDESATN
jgi:hypothetical protein